MSAVCIHTCVTAYFICLSVCQNTVSTQVIFNYNIELRSSIIHSKLVAYRILYEVKCKMISDLRNITKSFIVEPSLHNLLNTVILLNTVLGSITVSKQVIAINSE